MGLFESLVWSLFKFNYNYLDCLYRIDGKPYFKNLPIKQTMLICKYLIQLNHDNLYSIFKSLELFTVLQTFVYPLIIAIQINVVCLAVDGSKTKSNLKNIIT